MILKYDENPMTKNDSFNPNRLKFARERRAYTMKKLSDELGISSKTLSDFENGRRTPQKENFFESVSSILRFPEHFFFLDDIASLEKNIVSFRSLARMSASIRNAALCSGQIALEFIDWVEKRLDLPKTDLPDLCGEDPEMASLAVRTEWSLGELTIKNLIHLLESKGVRVFSLNEATKDMDAYSFWIDDRPFIFLNSMKSVERSRFDAAHELGHLILHKHEAAVGKDAEKEANRFASALLMPQGSVLARAPRFVSLRNIIDLKSCWLVSASALVRRLSDLSLLTEWQYRSLVIELSSSGYMKNEPNPIQHREGSKLIPKIFEFLREEGISKADVAKDLGIFVNELDELFFNLTLVGLPGGNNKQLSQPNRDKTHLRLLS
jgi:Zn-dependent peptidase ImmA (M78 family)/DNA-binding XRE family transcriptional regulator